MLGHHGGMRKPLCIYSKIYKSDNYSSTKDPLFNTQTYLRDSYNSTSAGGHIGMSRGGRMGRRT